jgi:hypothetical protein
MSKLPLELIYAFVISQTAVVGLAWNLCITPSSCKMFDDGIGHVVAVYSCIIYEHTEHLVLR